MKLYFVRCPQWSHDLFKEKKKVKGNSYNPVWPMLYWKYLAGIRKRRVGIWLILGIRVNVMGRKKMLISQSCPTLCDPMDCNPPGSSVHGILQARILEWVVIPFSRGSSQPRDWTQVSWIAGRFSAIWNKTKNLGSSLMVQWLGLHTATAGGLGSIPGWGTKIPQTIWHSQKGTTTTAEKKLTW